MVGKANPIPAKIVCVRNKANRKDWLAFICTATTLSEEEIIRIYGKRWQIEVFFKTCKSMLNLVGECHSLSYDALTAHVAIVFTRYMLLAMEQRQNEDQRTLGELFFFLVDEMADITFNRSLCILMEALIKNEVFKQVIETVNNSGYLKNLIIDEAHIVIEWGNFFRIDYQCLEPWRNNLYEKNSKLKTVLLSATYEKNTVNILKSMFVSGDKWIEIRCDALRREPRFELVTATSFRDKNEKTRELLRCLPRPMIVYVMRPDQAENIKEIAADIGISNVETFTGKTKPDDRSRIIDEWAENKFDIMVATSAFGVGVDKSDVRTVLHLYVPDNPNAYYQELGRGGRDGLPCLSVMCVYPEEDLESAFVMTDKVLGSDKILGRWDSMLNSHTSTRGIDYYTLDTSVKPNYNSVDYAEDASTVDQKWNIYVILLLRRYNMIKILDMVVVPQTIKGIAPEKEKADYASNKIKLGASWDFKQDNLDKMEKGLQEAETIIDSLGLGEDGGEILDFLKKVASGKASVHDLTPDILTWLMEKNMTTRLAVSFK